MLEVDMASPDLESIVEPNTPLDRIYHGLSFGEGPLWDQQNKELYFVDIVGSTIWKWVPGKGTEVVLHPSGHANGMTFDHNHRILVAGWGARTVWRFEKDGSTTVLASHYDGQKINSPNDIVVKTSDGGIYFTDSEGGLVNVGQCGEDVQRYLDFQGVYRISPDGSEVTLVTGDVYYPNGLAFSPDESLMYINDSRKGLIHVFDAKSDGSLENMRLFYTLVGDEPGIADGMKVDIEGNVYCTGPAGVHVLAPSGKLLGRLKIPGHTTNMAWGEDDWRALFITTYTGVYRARLKIPGIPVKQ